MKIKKMTAVFGGLKNETLEPGEGLNIITAPNERGKSTWCAFMKAMLFGIDSAQRSTAASLADKKRYAAWDGSPMAGEMDIEAEGRDITLTRSGKSAAPMKDFTAVYTGTASAVPGLTGATAGETLTGVSRSVYESSAFIGQNEMKVSQGPELEKRIASIVTTGDEEVSYSETEKRLAAWQRKRRYRTSGELPEIEAALEEKTEALDALRTSAGEIEGLESRVQRQEQRCTELRERMTESRKQARKDVLARSGAGRAALRTAEERAFEARAREKSLSERLEENPFHKEKPEAAAERAKAIAAKARVLAQTAGEAPKTSVPALAFIAAAVLVVAGIVSLFAGAGNLPVGIVLIVLGLACCVAGLVLLGKNKKIASASADAGAERESLLASCGVTSEEQLLAAAAEQAELYARWMEAKQTAEIAESELETARARQEKLEASVLNELDFSGGDSEAAMLGRELQSAEAELQRCRDELSHAKGRMGAMGDPMTIGSEIGELSHRRSVLENEYDALSVALSVLKEADAEMQTRFSPRLGARAAELFSRLTDGRYDRLSLTKDLSAEARRSGDTLAHDARFLSAGACDQLYLALRLAICELATPDASCPLVLDDALCSFDDERCRKALELLRELGKERQILLFSCHGREAEMMADAADVRCIRL